MRYISCDVTSSSQLWLCLTISRRGGKSLTAKILSFSFKSWIQFNWMHDNKHMYLPQSKIPLNNLKKKKKPQTEYLHLLTTKEFDSPKNPNRGKQSEKFVKVCWVRLQHILYVRLVFDFVLFHRSSSHICRYDVCFLSDCLFALWRNLFVGIFFFFFFLSRTVWPLSSLFTVFAIVCHSSAESSAQCEYPNL